MQALNNWYTSAEHQPLIETHDPNHHREAFDINSPGIMTVSGLGVGEMQARVIEVLGPSVEITPHKYLPPDGNYLTVWSANRRSALRFETHLGRVTSFCAGRLPEVRHVEVCA